MFPRHAERLVQEALSDTPVVLIHGPRQCGKSTLAESIAPGLKVTLDDPFALALARRDPDAFLAAYPPPVMIDEVQRAPELFLPIKRRVDKNRQPGAFLLTGSANVLNLPKMADSLAGRMEVIDLHPLAQTELSSTPARFVDALFGDAKRLTQGLTPHGNTANPEGIIDRILRGGFPEAVSRSTSSRREAWFANYVRTLLERDVRDVANVEALSQMPQLLNLLASRSGAVLNISSLSTDTGIPYTSLRRYLSLLESVFLIRLVNAWSMDRERIFTKTPKAYIADSGLMAYLCNLDSKALASDPIRFQTALESFVAMELLRECAASETRPWLLHLRTIRQLEVDFVLESRRGELVGIDLKPATTLHPNDAHALRYLRDVSGKRFHRGIVLYLGTEIQPLDADILGVPLTAIWA